jgi:hypothetical protein
MPRPVAELASWLVARGFDVETGQLSLAFGSQVLVFRDETIAVRAVSDRGLWSLEIATPQRDNWYDAEIWAACLDARDAPTEPRDLSAQAQFVRERLDDVRRAMIERTPDELLQCLLERQKDRFLRRMGRPESEIFAAE